MDLPLEIILLIAEFVDSSTFLIFRALSRPILISIQRLFEERYCKTARIILEDRVSISRLIARANSRYASCLEELQLSTYPSGSECPAEILQKLWCLNSCYSVARLTAALQKLPNCSSMQLGLLQPGGDDPMLCIPSLQSQEYSSRVISGAISAMKMSGSQVKALTISSSMSGPIYPISLPIASHNTFLSQ